MQDFGSRLASLRIVIEDEDERFAKVAWNEDVSGEKFKGHLDWDGTFKDGTVAPPGTYFAWIKAVDLAGNEYVALGRIIVPEPNSILRLFQPASVSSDSTVVPAPPSELFEDDEQLSPTVQPVQNTSTTASLVFGGSAAQAGTSTTQSLVLNAGAASSSPTSSNVLWGATAAAVLGAATAYALEENRKRREAEEAQRAGGRNISFEMLRRHPGGVGFEASDGSANVLLSIDKKVCEDGMSGLEFEYSATFHLGKETFVGCGRYDTLQTAQQHAEHFPGADGESLAVSFPDLPADAREVAERSAACTHFAGEFNGDDSESGKEVSAKMIQLRCYSVDGDVKAISKKYEGNWEVQRALEASSP